MPLREFQKLESFATGDIVYERVEVNSDTGASRVVEISQCRAVPSDDKTNLAKLIKSGVSLERVNCDLLNPRGVIPLPPTEEELKVVNNQSEVK